MSNKIALGTCVIDMLFHNPVILGRQFATLDVLSQGRCICGLGIGWSKDEYVASNVPFENRGARADEFIQALTQIWTDDIVEFKGRYYNIPAWKMGPKPIQKPHISIYLGGFTQRTYSKQWSSRKSSVRHQHSIKCVQINGEYSFKLSITQ